MVTIWQLRACGLDDKGVARRVRTGRLHRLHRGVYAVGHPDVCLRGRFRAAVSACPDGAALSHLSASAFWGFLPWEERYPEVTIVGSGTRRIDGVRVHRTRGLDLRDVWVRHGMRVTSPARTLLDLAAPLPERALRRAVRRAQAERLVSVRQVLEIVARSNGHRGTARLRAVVADGAAPTASELEDLVLDLLDRAEIARPLVNTSLRLDGRRIVPDLLWPAQRLVVEADGAAWHDHKLAREHDAERQALLEAHGYRVLRITWAQTVGHPQQTVARIRAALTR